MAKRYKILFVCLGNICRSPMAEAVFAHKAAQKGLKNTLLADSAGTAGYHIGDRPDRRTLKILSNHHITTPHIGRQVMPADFYEFDLILAMDNSNLADLKRKCPNNSLLSKVKLLTEYSQTYHLQEVPDPYYGTMEDFQKVFEMVEECSEHLLKSLT